MVTETMRAAVCEAPGKIVARDLSIPRAGPGELLVEVASSGICGCDLRAYQGRYPNINYPIILGHEFSGTVAALGKGVDEFEVGDEVICEPMFPCGECRACLSGDYNLCNALMMAGYQVPGSFAEYVVVKASMAYPKDESVSFLEAAMIEPLAVAVHAVKRAGIGIGDTVAVLGLGSIGLLTSQLAKKSCAKVVGIDIFSEKLHLAANLGIDYAISPESSDPRELVMALTKDRGADVVLECAGKQETLAQSVELMRKGGTIVLVGWTGNDLDEIPLTKVTMNEIKLLGSSNYCRDFPTAIELVTSGEIDVRSMVSHEFKLSQIGKALEELSREGNEIIKAVVAYD